ncbi:hypothetical protein E4198_09030 [Streptomyces sp. RKND-216]|uniref:hypothetical protein n=1 Tax=Streptomyces sp. RKND-216 TaxID=2562581 RepID=UPI00109DD41B|nr:hypothetical protein [Streptomyces sp. RKND-216]THA24853.1 hypothetical protein E4198_09030 [Streptomyces sp. RKND-216]
MTQNSKLLAASLVGGYLLGRTRKAKLALALASWVLGRRKGLNPQRLLTEGLKRLTGSPEFSQLNDQLRGELMAAGRSLVTAAANRRLDSLSDALRDRTDSLSGLGGAAGGVAGREQAEDSEEGEEPEETAEKRPAREASAKKAAPPKKTAAKKAPAKKTGAAAKKTTGKKTAVKKTAARKAASPSTRRPRGR